MVSKKQVGRKNGKIEFLRFFFCIAVLLFHAQKYIVGSVSFKDGIHLSMFPHGAMGVEFFFLLSGFLMAKSVYKIKSATALNGYEYNEKTLSQNSLTFLKRKYLSVFPQHCVAFVFAFIALALKDNFTLKQGILKLVDSIPNFFLVQMTGVNFSNPNHLEWYISCMLIAMAIIYPLCSKFYYSFTRYVAPFLALMTLGYMIYTTKSLTGVSVWMGLSYKSMFRAIAEVALGTTAFEFSRYLSSKQYNSSRRLLFTAFEIFCFVATAVYLVTTMPLKYEIYMVVLLFMLVSIAFSGVSYGNGIFDNKFVYFLGSLSLPIYLGQLTAIYTIQAYMTKYSIKIQLVSVVAMTFLVAFIIMFVGNQLSKLLVKKHTVSL